MFGQYVTYFAIDSKHIYVVVATNLEQNINGKITLKQPQLQTNIEFKVRTIFFFLCYNNFFFKLSFSSDCAAVLGG